MDQFDRSGDLGPQLACALKAARAGANQANMIARILQCSCGWIVEQETYDEKDKLLEIIRESILRHFQTIGAK